MNSSTSNSENDNLPGIRTNRRSYLSWYLLTLLALFTLTAGFNAVIDPKARLLIFDIQGFNQIKIALERDTRTGKATALRLCNFDTIVLGASRAETGLEMNHPAFSNAEPYNAALKAGSVYEMRRMAEYALQQGDMTTALLGLDFIAFDSQLFTADDFSDSPLAENISPASIGRYLLSLRTLKESWGTLTWNHRGISMNCDDRGEHKREKALKKPRIAFDRILRRYAEGPYARYVPGDQHIHHLKATLQVLSDSGVTIYAFISPMHATQLELMAELGMLDDFHRWKRALVQVFEDINQGLPEERRAVLWDFSGYNEITTEKVPPLNEDKFMLWYNDSSHFNHSVGNLIIDRLYGLQSQATVTTEPFGRLITPDNIDEIIEDEKHDSDRYRTENPDEIIRIREIGKLFPAKDKSSAMVP